MKQIWVENAARFEPLNRCYTPRALARAQRGLSEAKKFCSQYYLYVSVGDNNTDAGRTGDAPYGVSDEGSRSETDCRQ